MKTQWDLAGFSLDTSLLWNLSTGPKNSDLEVGRIKAADQRLREKFQSGRVGFYSLAAEKADLDRILALNAQIRREFEAALVLGIGGSFLGAASAVQAVGDEAFPLTWVSNIDPAAIRTATKQLNERKHATLVISKSGNTTETLAAFYHFSPKLDPKGFVIITDPTTGELRRLANENRWQTLSVPPNIGGRFSVLSPVGLLPCALGGVDIEALMKGARKMHDLLDDSSPEQNPAYLFALALHLWDEKCAHGLQYLMPYWSSLQFFAQWYVQLWGESLGKVTSDGKRVGPTPIAALGSTDQHSLLQLFKEGPRNKLVGFLDVLTQGGEIEVGDAAFRTGDSGYLCRHSFEKISREASSATLRSLTNSSIPTYRITVPRLNAEALGALFFFFETATAFAGELYQINAFDQPGVEETKKLLHAALSA